jgi:transketolase
MRKEFGKVISELLIKDPRVFLLSADMDFGLFNNIQAQKLTHAINTGLREQATIGIAAGMALQGLKPYIYGITPFVLDRVAEQLKLDVGQQKVDVKIISYWDYPTGGPTHLTENPKDLCRLLGIRFFEPRDPAETRQILMETYLDTKPAFFYLTGAKS